MAAVIRLKRKASDEPAEGLLIAVKKSKYESADTNEVLFKFAATLKNEKESLRDQIQAAVAKENSKKFTQWRNPKDIALSKSTVKKLNEKIKSEHKDLVAKKKLDILNHKRLIKSDEFQDLEEGPLKDAEVRESFHLYDIIEENEDIKKQNDEVENVIMCNDTPLIREKCDDYVFDVYIADREIDHSFVDRTVSVMPCTLTEDDIYFGDSDESGEVYEDDDDSNDENNWRNDYPEDADSSSEKDGDSDSLHCDDFYGDYDDNDQHEVRDALNNFGIGGDSDDSDCDELERTTFDYEKVMKELEEEDSKD